MGAARGGDPRTDRHCQRAIAGVVITQRRSDACDRAAWKRERERWAHEDAARTFDLRREAYIEFDAAVDAQINDFLDNKGYLRGGRRQKAIDPRNRSFDAELAPSYWDE